MATTTVNYGTTTTITIGLNSLATSSTLTAGRESSQIDNTTNKFVDALVQGVITVGTTPTVNKSINVYVWGSDTSTASTNLDSLDGTDSAETLTNESVRNSLLKLAATVYLTAATSDVAYPIGSFGVAQFFGGVLPKYWGLFVTHETGVNLNSTLNTDKFTYTGIKYDIA